MKKPFIIAEIAQGYEGSRKLVELYVEAASNAGADAIKFQIFFADELALKDYKYYELFKDLELPFEVWEQAIKKSHEKGMEFYSDIFGIDSFNALNKIGIDGCKIHSTDINNTSLLKHIAASKKKVYLSTGACDPEEIATALEILDGCDVTLLHGFQAEPTETQDNNLSRIQSIKKRFNKSIGFQDHTAGDSEMAFYLSFVAMGAGVDVLEKHLTLSRTARIEDYISALNPEEFSKWVLLIKEAYACLGEEKWEVTDKEKIYRAKVRRAVCAAKDIRAGETIDEGKVNLKRTDNQDAIFNIEEVLNKIAKNNINNNSVITSNDIK